ncbi:MAG TPA: preprotein translocase subunit YajC [Patescibacteria group bacterium]|nr:preprotein translocase subunit YajC [Patescibacteria group bacterium]
MPNQQLAGFVNAIPLVFVFIIFYFLIFRPQRQKEKEHATMISNLNKNDEVVTSGGIHGTIVNVKEKTLIVRIDENVKIEVEKSAIAYRKKAQSENPGA